MTHRARSRHILAAVLRAALAGTGLVFLLYAAGWALTNVVLDGLQKSTDQKVDRPDPAPIELGPIAWEVGGLVFVVVLVRNLRERR